MLTFRDVDGLYAQFIVTVSLVKWRRICSPFLGAEDEIAKTMGEKWKHFFSSGQCN